MNFVANHVEDVGIAWHHLIDRLFKEFPLQIHGAPRSKSQFKEPYIVWINGYLVEEGHTVPETILSPEDLADSFIAYLKKYLAGGDIIVWRAFPNFEYSDGNLRLRARFHKITRTKMLDY